MSERNSKTFSVCGKDWVGHRFGRWTVIENAVRFSSAVYKSKCRCDCGTERLVNIYSLVRGLSLSCGCFRDERIVESHTTHGGTNRSEYNIWIGMKQRCMTETNHAYKDYGGRGITVCDRWIGSFENFLADMGDRPSPRHQIERIDNDKGYCPENCRWATPLEQSQNKRSNHRLTYNGKTMIIQDWARETGIQQSTISIRLKMGWSVERALTEIPPEKAEFGRRTIVEYRGESMTVRELAKLTAHPVDRVVKRLNKGWSVSDAVGTMRNGNPRARKVIYHGQEVKLNDLAIRFNIPYTTLHGRIERGWAIDDAVDTPVQEQHGGNYVNHPRPPRSS